MDGTQSNPSNSGNPSNPSSPGSGGVTQQGDSGGVQAVGEPQGQTTQVTTPVSPREKEVEPSQTRQGPVASDKPEKVEVAEVKEPEQVPEEVAGWMERVERGEDVHLAKPVTHMGQTLVEPAKPKDVRVVLPLTEEGVKKGLHHKIADSVRWLAHWCVRLVKKLPGKVIYRKLT